MTIPISEIAQDRPVRLIPTACYKPAVLGALVALEPGAAGPGGEVLFRMRPDAVVKHAAILSGGGRMVHVVSRDRVREVAMGVWRWRRIGSASATWSSASGSRR